MRFLLLCLALLLFAGCSPTEVAVLPTLDGPVVPTRVIPSATPTLPATETPTPTQTFTPTEIPPTDTPSATAAPRETPVPASATPSLMPSPTETVAIAIPSATNTVATPLPSPTNTVEILTPSATHTVETPASTPVATPTPTASPTLSPLLLDPVIYRSSTWQEPVEINTAVTLDTPISGTIDDPHPAVLYSFAGTAGMTIDVSMTEQTGNLDAFLLILDPKGREIVRNDDEIVGNGNSAVRGVILPEAGTYVIVATRYGQQFGTSSGDFTLTLTNASGERVGSFSRQTGYDSLISDTLDDDNPEQVYTFRATAGDVISIQMTTTSGDLDPNITLTNNLGTPLTYNDDNLLMGTLDSAMQNFIIPRSGYYAIIARRYSDNASSGDYRLKLALDGQNATSIYAVLNPVNSASVSEEGTLFTNFNIGDEIDDETGQEHTYQVLLTFHLPPNDDQAVDEAMLGIAPCFERGGGFDELGTLTIYQDNYGSINRTRNITRPLPGARILDTQDGCDSLDLTDLVQEAYDNGDPDVQIRLIFRDHTNNGETDSVLISPSLLITFEE
ncbi:MAG: hypothetical protein ABI835_12450 [Chloroflexota bacterium]